MIATRTSTRARLIFVCTDICREAELLFMVFLSTTATRGQLPLQHCCAADTCGAALSRQSPADIGVLCVFLKSTAGDSHAPLLGGAMVLLFGSREVLRATDNSAIAHFPDSGHGSTGSLSVQGATKV